MGNSAILVVFASVLSGIMIFLNIQRINTEANVVQSNLQDEVLARELAHNGLNLVLARHYRNNPSSNTSTTIDYQGGTIDIETSVSSTGGPITFEVLGEYRDAQYLIHSEYNYATQFNCAICTEGPYIDMPMHEDATINGGSRVGDPDFSAFVISTAEYDRLQNQPGLGGLYDFTEVEKNLNDALFRAREGLPGEVTEVNVLDSDQSLNDILPDIDPDQENPWLQEFYFTALDKMQFGDGSADAYYGPPADEKGAPHLEEFGSLIPEAADYGETYSFGGADVNAIVRIDGDMAIRSGSTVSGNGILIVEGNLTVDPGAILNWNGILYLRPETSHSVTTLAGDVTINGALVAYQEALPPGSHMDVTTNRDLTGTWSIPEGRETGQAGIPIPGPWFVHIHKWDQSWFSRPPISASREVLFRSLRNSTTQEKSIRFNETMNALASVPGIDKVFLEFVNPSQSGMAVFNLSLNQNGIPVNYSGSVSNGFNGSPRSIAFDPNDLIDFGMMIRSVRFLQLVKDPDPEGSNRDGAVRVAKDYARKGSFYVAVRNADENSNNELLMTTAIYQHIREDESEDYEEELSELKDDIINGNFGLTIDMGPGATIRYDDVAASNALLRTEFPALTHHRTYTRRCNSNDVNCELSLNSLN